MLGVSEVIVAVGVAVEVETEGIVLVIVEASGMVPKRGVALSARLGVDKSGEAVSSGAVVVGVVLSTSEVLKVAVVVSEGV